MQRSDCLVWIDLEMTGLNPESHVIVEIATIITDRELTIIEQGPSFIIHQSAQTLEAMDTFAQVLHEKSGLLEQIAQSPISQQQAEQETLAFIKKHCQPNTALLAGNSVWMDRSFLQKHMPSIVDYLFYRIIDVSTIKELVGSWYSGDHKIEFEKGETHRALADIRESIAELKHYRDTFFR